MELAKRIITGVVLFLFGCFSVFGKHQVGGEMYYEIIGPGAWPNSKLYQFTIIHYVDCSISVQTIIARKNHVGFDPNLSSDVILLEYKDIRNFNYNEILCNARPPGSCYQRVEFSDTISVRAEFLPYEIYSSECCRDPIIDNIITPDSTGIITSIEINRRAYDLDNNSPVFENSKFLSFCVNEPVDFDYEISEADGDQLVYKFCTPSGEEKAVFDQQPLARPYPTVQYISPIYTANYPLGEEGLKINATTGQLTGTPQITGNFAVGICVEEYRNGELLSIVRQDLTVNVVACNFAVDAALFSQTTDAQNRAVYQLCNENTLTIENLSGPSESITDYEWYINYPDQPLTSNLKIPTFTFGQPGIFYGHLVVNPDSICHDTAFFVVEMSSLSADFSWQSSTDPAAFKTIAFIADSERALGWNWIFATSSLPDIRRHLTYTFPDTGYHDVTLIVEDQYGCFDTLTQRIDVVPPQTYFLPNAFTPNGDGLNDEFIGVGFTDYLQGFEMNIFDRWGGLVFSSTDAQRGWDGSNAAAGVYVYRVRYRVPRGKRTELRGEVVLVR